MSLSCLVLLIGWLSLVPQETSIWRHYQRLYPNVNTDVHVPVASISSIKIFPFNYFQKDVSKSWEIPQRNNVYKYESFYLNCYIPSSCLVLTSNRVLYCVNGSTMSCSRNLRRYLRLQMCAMNENCFQGR